MFMNWYAIAVYLPTTKNCENVGIKCEKNWLTGI